MPMSRSAFASGVLASCLVHTNSGPSRAEISTGFRDISSRHRVSGAHSFMASLSSSSSAAAARRTRITRASPPTFVCAPAGKAVPWVSLMMVMASSWWLMI